MSNRPSIRPADTKPETSATTHLGKDSSPTLDVNSSEISTPFTPVAGSRVGPYQLVEKLGEGGMGAVWKAVHTRLEKTVAVKLLPDRLLINPHVIARFEREMRAAGRVVHPNVIQAFDAGDANGIHYLAMEYVAGEDLHARIRAKGALSVPDSCRAIRQAALGLAAAHAEGLVHRDVKPQNLLVSPTGEIKLLDLGLSRLAEDAEMEASANGLTAAGQIMGTPDYMAPEQWDDSHSVGAAADLYALGCTLYFVLTGRPPFSSENPLTAPQKMKAHLSEPAPNLRAARPDVPPELDKIYQRLMAKTPADRFASAEELADALAPLTTSSANDTDTFVQPGATPVSMVASLPATEPDFVNDLTFISGRGPTASAPTRLEGARPQASGADKPPHSPRSLLLAAAGGFGAIVLFCGILILITHPDGTRTEMKLSEGAKVRVQQDGEIIGTYPQPATPSASTPPAMKNDGENIPIDWTPGPAETALRGLIPQPAKLPNVGRWNLTTIAPATESGNIAWSPDGTAIALATETGLIRIYDSEFRQLQQVFSGHTSAIRALCWSPDSEQLASGAWDKTVRIWSRDGMMGPVLEGFTDGVMSLDWGLHNQIVCGCYWRDERIQVWNARGDREAMLDGKSNLTMGIGWRPGHNAIAFSRASDQTFQLWDLTSGDVSLLAKCPERPPSLAWSPDGKRLAISGGPFEEFNEEGFSTKGWIIDADTPDQRVEIRFSGLQSWINQLAWHPQGGLAAATQDGFVVLIDEKTGQMIGHSGQGAITRSLTWSNDGTRLADSIGRLFQVAAYGPKLIRAWPQVTITRTETPPSEADQPAVTIEIAEGGTYDFSAGGKMLKGDSQATERELAYLVEQQDGRLEILSPRAFFNRVNGHDPQE